MYIFIILYNDMILQKCVALVPKAPTANLEGPGTETALAQGEKAHQPIQFQCGKTLPSKIFAREICFWFFRSVVGRLDKLVRFLNLEI